MTTLNDIVLESNDHMHPDELKDFWLTAYKDEERRNRIWLWHTDASSRKTHRIPKHWVAYNRLFKQGWTDNQIMHLSDDELESVRKDEIQEIREREYKLEHYHDHISKRGNKNWSYSKTKYKLKELTFA